MEDELPPAKRDNQLRTCLDAPSLAPVPTDSCTGNLHCPKRSLAFRPYTPPKNFNKRQSLPFIFKKSPVVKLTKDIALTYKICNPQFFWYSEELNPKRYLTIPSEGVLNNGHDNANSDLILSANYILINIDTQRRYVVKDILGHGTFGQVAKCYIEESNTFVAVKIIKNEPAYYQQALVEVSILASLNKKYDPDDQHHIVRIFDYFVHHNHLCISFELLDMNLYSLIKINNFRGLSLNIVQLFSKQILMGLRLMKDVGIIHCDLKPENILCTSDKPDNIKIIDFGSACLEDHTVYSYIQSRYYRSPEVILGYQYTTAIDMWSFGCIVAELFLGLPLFPGASEFDLLRRMINIRGGYPPDHVLKEAKNTSKYFKFLGSVCFVDRGGISVGYRSSFRSLTLEEFEMRELKKPLIGKEYFNHMNIDEIVKNYPYGKLLPEQDIAKESQTRLALIDFLKGLVEFDPAKRWSPFQASQHPFVTGEPFTCPYNPPLRTPHIIVSQSMKIHHHPGGGHWLAAGISPGMAGRKWGLNHNSPFVQMMPFAHANNFGSLGSHSSYGDSMIGTSYGSYGDCNDISAYFSPVGTGTRGICDRVSVLGTSPDSKPRFSYQQQPRGNGNVSPSASGFSPLALGSSPSWFTPPNKYNHISAGSPGNYDPCSPKGSSCYGIPLGKNVRTNPFSRRKSLGPNGQAQKSIEMPFFSPGKSNFMDDTYLTAERVCHIVPSPISSRQSSSIKNISNEQGGFMDVSSRLPTQFSPGSYSTSSSCSQNKQVMLHRDDTAASESMPTPSDWDPNYSDDLLLQDDSLEVDNLSSDFNMGLVIPQTLVHDKMVDGIRTPAYTSFNRGYIQEKSTRYMASLSKSSNLNPVKTTIPPGMHWNHMHFHSPSQLFSGGNSEHPRSPPQGRNGCGRIV